MMSVMVYPYRGIQFGTVSGDQRLFSQQLDRSFQIIQVFVSLFFSLLVKGIQPNVDQVLIDQSLLDDSWHQGD